MARFNPDRRGMAMILLSREVQAACVRRARAEAARIAAATPVDTSQTRDSTRVEPADFGDRLGAIIVQEGAAVALNFGNARTRAIHHVQRGR